MTPPARGRQRQRKGCGVLVGEALAATAEVTAITIAWARVEPPRRRPHTPAWDILRRPGFQSDRRPPGRQLGQLAAEHRRRSGPSSPRCKAIHIPSWCCASPGSHGTPGDQPAPPWCWAPRGTSGSITGVSHACSVSHLRPPREPHRRTPARVGHELVVPRPATSSGSVAIVRRDGPTRDKRRHRPTAPPATSPPATSPPVTSPPVDHLHRRAGDDTTTWSSGEPYDGGPPDSRVCRERHHRGHGLAISPLWPVDVAIGFMTLKLPLRHCCFPCQFMRPSICSLLTACLMPGHCCSDRSRGPAGTACCSVRGPWPPGH